ncbi:MAG: peptidylprolyl isomerase [Clostridia bacterium]|nr:peptidylprolyl isomerase [Clostridia bacterium]
MMAKKILGLLLALMLVFSIPVMAETMEINATYDLVSVRVNGTYLNAPSYLYENQVYVPLRSVLEAMGAKVEWNDETKSITITTNANEPTMETRAFSISKGEEHSFEAYINYVKVSIDGQEKIFSHFLYNGTTYVPVSVFYDHFGCHVMQHIETMSVRIYEPGYKTFQENETLFVNDKAYTETEIQGISSVVSGNPNPTTIYDYARVEENLISASAFEKIGEMMASKDGFEDFYKQNDLDTVLKAYGDEHKETIIENLVWPSYYSKNLVTEAVDNYFKPTEEALAEYLTKTDYHNGRWLKAKHILINKTEDESGFKQAEEVLTAVKENPEIFDNMMATYSQDPGSVTQPDGYLFTEGDMVTEFYEGTLPLQVGEISGIVESQYGYHIILKVADYKDGVPLEEVKDEIKALYLNNALNNLYIELMAETDTVANHTMIEEK